MVCSFIQSNDHLASIIRLRSQRLSPFYYFQNDYIIKWVASRPTFGLVVPPSELEDNLRRPNIVFAHDSFGATIRHPLSFHADAKNITKKVLISRCFLKETLKTSNVTLSLSATS